MPSPKDGKPGSLVSPAAPRTALDADDADPGQVEEFKAVQLQSSKGKYGSTPITPFKPDPKKTGWIEIVLVDQDNQPIAGEAYEVTLPDASLASGTLDAVGFARVSGFDPGTCHVTFPDFDGDAWKQA